MISTKKSQKSLKGKNLFCNFLNMDLSLGDILIMDKKDHNKWGNIEDFIPGIKVESFEEKGPKMELDFQSESKIGIEFGGKMKGQQLKEDEAFIKFNSSKTTFVSLHEISHWVLPIGKIEHLLKKLWEEKGLNDGSKKRHYHLVTKLFKANSGLLIYSQNANNVIKLKSSLNLPLLSNSDILSGNLDISTCSKTNLYIKSLEPFSPIYGAIRMNAKGEFVTVG